MDEKKLTYEEIVKALENCINGFDSHDGLKRHSCEVCPYKEVEACGKAQMIDLLNLINRQKAEIERLTEEKETLYFEGQNFKTYIENHEEIWKRNAMIETAELQKQVDELKEKQFIECHGMLKGCDMVKQAVKDTAREIFDKSISGFAFCIVDANKDYEEGYMDGLIDYRERLKEFAKEKGVEVE